MKIREISTAFGISPETLRFLEQEGILHPKRNADNAYREYEITDFGTIMEYMKLKNMGFSIRDIVSLMQGNSFQDACTGIQEKYNKLQSTLYTEQLLCQYMDEFRSKLEVFGDNEGLYHICTGDSLACLSVGSADPGAEKYHGDQMALEWRKHAPFVALGYLMEAENTQLGLRPIECVLTAENRYIKAFSVPTDPSIKNLSMERYICTYAHFVDFESSYNIYDGILSFAKERNCKVCGPFTTILLLRLENGVRYVEIRLPIAKTL